MTVTQSIRAAIADLHAAIEKTDFSIALVAGRLDAESYCASLSQLWHIHAALERAENNPVISGFFSPDIVRTPAIDRDLSHWSYPLAASEIFAVTKDVVTEMAKLNVQSPVSLLAYMYVLEGSRMGSMFIAKPLATALGVLPVDGQGIDYHTEDMRQTPARFGALKSRMDASVTEPKQIELLCKTAVDFMASLNSIYELLPTAAISHENVKKSEKLSIVEVA